MMHWIFTVDYWTSHRTYCELTSSFISAHVCSFLLSQRLFARFSMISVFFQGRCLLLKLVLLFFYISEYTTSAATSHRWSRIDNGPSHSATGFANIDKTLTRTRRTETSCRGGLACPTSRLLCGLPTPAEESRKSDCTHGRTDDIEMMSFMRSHCQHHLEQC